MKPNTLSVTLMTNIPLSVGTLITLTNLNGAITPTSEIMLDGAHKAKFQSGSGSADGLAYFDSQYKKMTVRVKTLIAAGVITSFSFDLQNSNCNQSSPAVCVRASRISTDCLTCSLGQCVTLSRQSMDRDFVSIFDYGSKGNPNHGNSAYYNSGAVITYAEQPPQAGDAAPLAVYAPVWVISNITQSSPYPGSLTNTISATIASNVPIVADSIITLSGLTGSKTVSDPKYNLSSHSAVFEMMAPWSQTDGTLKVRVASDTVGGEIYHLSFTLENPDCQQSAPDVYIASSPICFSKIKMTSFVANMSTPSHLSGIFNAEAIESSPLLIRAPSFLVAEVWQSNPFAAALNTIDLQFSTNIDVVASTRLTVSGLPGAVNYESTLDVVETGSNILASAGTWNNQTGTLIVDFSAKSRAGTAYNFSFTVRNPKCCNMSIGNVQIHTSVECFEAVDARVVTNKGLLASAVSEGEDVESTPLKIRCPRWRHASIAQNSDLPCVDNKLDASLTLNVPIPAGALLTLTGLTDTGTADGQLAITSVPPGVMTSGNFSQASGTIIIAFMLDVAALANVTASFTIINPPRIVASKLGTVKMRLDQICKLDAEYVLAQSNGGVIKVKQATFSVKKIGQRTSWPGAHNVITITLNSAVPLFGTTPHVRCDTNITISGFDGACVNGDSTRVEGVNGTYSDHPVLQNLPLTGPNASLFNNVTWHSEMQAVIMRVVGPLGVEGFAAAIFSFAVVNPVASQPSPRIEVKSMGIPIELVEMEKDGSQLEDSTYDHNRDGIWNDSTVQHVGSPNGAVFNSTMRAAEPLRVISPAFVVRHIGQSTPYPGGNNSLSITISPNVDLSVGAVIVISSLMSLDGSKGAQTGALHLMDGNNHPNGKSTTDDTRYFAAYSGGTSGAGLWDDSSRSLTLFVVSKLTAGSFYSFQFILKNPLCVQPGQPVCIRARNINVGCKNGVVIARRLMEHDLVTVPSSALNATQGHAAPLLIFQPVITHASMIQSSPWPSSNNTLTVTLSTNVPLFKQAFSPKITITNLVGTVTTQASIKVTWTKLGDNSSTISALFDAASGELVFSVPEDTEAGQQYVASFELKNKNCEQDAPNTTIQISGGEGNDVCFQPRDLLQLTSVHCNLPTRPLQIMGGPCAGGGSTSAMFTLKNISQSTPYGGCDNKITVKFTSNIPLRYADSSVVELFISADLAVGLLPGDVVLEGNSAGHFFGTRERTNETARGRWSPDMSPPRLMLNVANGQDLEACTMYEISFIVVNPMTDNVKASQPADSRLLQAATNVDISARGTMGVTIVQVTMNVDQAAAMNLPGTISEDYAPLQVLRPYFLTQEIGQSSPFPGDPKNEISVTLAANTKLHTGSVIAIHRITGAIAADGNIRLNGTDSNLFKSMSGAVGFGTWNDCDKALFVTPVADLACDGSNYTFTVVIYNPVEPQLCAEVLLNATLLDNPAVFRSVAGQPNNVSMTQSNADEFGSVHGGYDMLRDTWSTPAIYGAMPGDRYRYPQKSPTKEPYVNTYGKNFASKMQPYAYYLSA